MTGKEYKLTLDGYGFITEKTTYAEGEDVLVYFRLIATDTDYHFGVDCDDVKLNQSYDSAHGYVFTFQMPAHDVRMFVDSRNTMINPFANSGVWRPVH